VAQLLYELSFKGAASAALRAAFEDCAISTTRGTTVLRMAVPDRAAAQGLIDRVNGLGLEILEFHLVAEPSASGPSG
jgi:hypothetical protein